MVPVEPTHSPSGWTKRLQTRGFGVINGELLMSLLIIVLYNSKRVSDDATLSCTSCKYIQATSKALHSFTISGDMFGSSHVLTHFTSKYQNIPTL